jgi:diacylglycerol kinase family enzyme
VCSLARDDPRWFTSPPLPLQLLVFVNPASGSGRAQQLWQSVEPMFLRHAHVEVSVIQTTCQGHARKYVSDPDFPLTRVDGVVTVSGDGLLSELLQGIMARPDGDWQAVLNRLVLCALPAGSGNGMATTCLRLSRETPSIVNSAFLAVRGFWRPQDMYSCEQFPQPPASSSSSASSSLSSSSPQSEPDPRTRPSPTPMFGFLAIAWAVIADVDLESEKYRCCGSARFTFAAVARICCPRQYNATISYMLADGDNETQFKTASSPSTSASPSASSSSKAASSSSQSRSAASATTTTQCSRNLPRCQQWAQCHTCRSRCTAARQSAAMRELSLFVTAHPSLSQPSSIETAAATATESMSEPASAAAAAAAATAAMKELTLLHNAQDRPWIDDDDSYFMFWALVQSWASSDNYSAPLCHSADGAMDVLTLRQASRADLLSSFIKMETGAHLSTHADVSGDSSNSNSNNNNNSYNQERRRSSKKSETSLLVADERDPFGDAPLECRKVKALRLHPAEDRGQRVCELSIDGEHFPCAETEVRVYPGVLRISCL